MDPSSWPAWTRPAFLLVAWCLIGTSVARYDPIKDLCRIWGHQSAVVDRKLYIDGGLVNYMRRNDTSPSKNLSDPFLAYFDLDVSIEGNPPLYANLSKNHTIPSVNGGILWEDSVNKRLYLYGGQYYETSPSADFILYSYDILYNEWVSFGPPKGAGITDAVSSYGAGISIPSRGEAYYYGGWLSNASVPGWKGPPRATNSFIKYTMDSNSWSNLTGPDHIPRAEGTMVFIPIGDAGMLVYFGGIKDLYGNGTLTPQPLDQIFLFDVVNEKWYTQKTSGHTPKIRRRFCGGATWAQDQSSYNIYIYGGAGFPPNTEGYDDTYILTIPSFQWINSTGRFTLYPTSMMSCNVVDNAQMLIIGGTNPDGFGGFCDVVPGPVWNKFLGRQKANADWSDYQPNLTTYAVPPDIRQDVGGNEFGGATRTAPTSGFDAPDLSVLMTRTSRPATRTPTRQIDLTTTPSSNSRPLSAGAIAGIAVGCSVALVLALVGCCFFIHRRRKDYSHGHAVEPPAVGMDGTQMSSPKGAAALYRDQQSIRPAGPPAELASGSRGPPAELASGSRGPPAELASEGELHYGHRSMSPTRGKFENGSGGPQPVTTNDRPVSSPGQSPAGDITVAQPLLSE